MYLKTLSKHLILLTSIIIIIGTILLSNSSVSAQDIPSSAMQNGDTISYRFRSTGAFIPYADQYLHFEIVNISDPSNVLVNVLYGANTLEEAEILNASIPATWYILNNNSLQSNWLDCPLQNITESKISEYWIESNLHNVSEYYNDVERDAIELSYTYATLLNGDNYSISVRWLWDYSTGILLNNSIQFTNLVDYSLSGEYEQYLDSTSIWELSTRVIPGFPALWVILIAIITIIGLINLVIRRKSLPIFPHFPKFLKMAGISLLILSSLFILNLNILPEARAAPLRSMPGANVLLITNNTNSALGISLGLDDSIFYSTFVEGINSTQDLLDLDYSLYDVIIADGYLPNNMTVLHKIKSNINGTEANAGLIFFGGNYTENALLTFSSVLPVEFVINRGALNSTITEFFIEQAGFPIFTTSSFYKQLYEETSFFEIQNNDVQVAVSDEQNSLPEQERSMYVTRIAWESTPLLYERILTYAKKVNASTIIEVPDTNEPLIVSWEQDWNGDDNFSQVIFVSPGVATIWDYEKGENNEWNTPFRLWPYFNYFVYLMIYDVKGLDPEQIESYADWPWSPIPHQREAIIWMVFVGSLWIFNFTLFFVLRKKSKKRDLAQKNNSPNL